MITVNGVTLRNLQEQVEKNKNDIQDFKDGNQTIAEFGIYVQGILSNKSLLPETGENFGDAYLIGTASPYDMVVWTRKDNGTVGEWVDLGSFPLAGPKGEQGEEGSQIFTGNGNPLTQPYRIGDYYLNVTNGDLWTSYKEASGTLLWQKVGNLKGPRGERGERGYQGIQGATGATGATGPIGPQGVQGPVGPVGPAFNIQGTLTSTSQLPTPTAEMQDKGYCYRIPDANGVPHIWVVEGANEVGPFEWTDIGVAGIQGPVGPAGKGIDTLTDVNLTLGDTTVQYDTTDGMQITSTGRFTYESGQTDATVDLDIPLVPGRYITIDKVNNKEQVRVSLNTDGTFSGLNVQDPTLKGGQYSEVFVEGANGLTFTWPNQNKATTTLPVAYDGQNAIIATDKNTKTLFGNQSIVGPGNIDLYRHVIKGVGGGCEWVTTLISSKNILIDSLTDLYAALRDCESYPANGWFQQMSSGTVYAFEPKASGNILYASNNGGNDTISWTNAGPWTITDTVTTV